jgi:hypothetical protein
VWAKAMGASNVPSYDAYLKATLDVSNACGGSGQQQYTGAEGNTFYHNNIPTAIAQVRTSVSFLQIKFDVRVAGLQQSQITASHASVWTAPGRPS